MSSASSEGQTVELSLKMTDATTTDFQAVYITVDEIQASMAPLDETKGNHRARDRPFKA